MEGLTSLQFTAGVYIERKTPASSFRDKVIKVASAMRTDPLRKGWGPAVWRAFVLLSVLSPGPQSDSQHRQLVSWATQHCTPCGKRFTLASYQQTGPSLLLEPPQDSGATQRLVFPIWKYILCAPLHSNPVLQLIQSKLITHIILTVDFPS